MSNIVNLSGSVKQKILDGALNPLRLLLPAALVEKWCVEMGYDWRERIFGATMTLLSCIFKHLEQGASSRDVEDWIASLSDGTAFERTRQDGADFCRARVRLPIRIYQLAFMHVGGQAAATGGQLWRSLRVCFVDGSTAKTERTRLNRCAFGLASNQHGAAALPVLRFVILVCAGCGAVLDAAWCPYVLGEMRLFVAILQRMKPGHLVVGDSLFGTFLSFSLLLKKDCHGLCQVHSSRKDHFRRRLGKRDEIHVWNKPSSGHSLFPHFLSLFQEEIEVRVITREIRRRGYKTWTLRICTTLLDAQTYPADDLIELYMKRWHVETDLRSLKITHGLTRFTGKTPQVVCREFYAGLLAYNCVRGVMTQTPSSARDLSHERARTLICQCSAQMSHALTQQLPRLYRRLLRFIANGTLEKLKRPPEPRAVVENIRRYPLLKETRSAWRAAHIAVS